MAQTYLITCGAGNLARQLVGQLTGQDDQVVLFDIAGQPDLTRINRCCSPKNCIQQDR